MRRNNLSVKILLAVLLWSFIGATLGTALRGDWYTTWRRLNVPTIKPPFFDLRGIPLAVEASQKGRDPYTEIIPPFTPPLNAPWKIEFDYPRAWIVLFSTFDITQDKAPFAALAFIASYLACLTVLIIRSDGLFGSIAVFLAAFSSASLLAIERGNNDLLTFSLVLLGTQSSAITVFLFFLGLATVLKLYPVAGLAAAGLFKKERLAVGIAVCFAAFYFWTQRADIAKIPNNIPAAFGQSYGVQSIAIGLSHVGLPGMRIPTFIITLAITLFCAWKGFQWAGRVTFPQLPKPELAYIVFTAIFVGTFLISPNFEYRLIFLIPTLPFYALLLKNPATRTIGATAIALTFVAMNGQIFGHLAPWKVLSHLARTLLVPVTAFFLGSVAYPLELFTFATNWVPAEAARASKRFPHSFQQ